MKKFLLPILILLIAIETNGQWYAGGKAGIALSNYRSKTSWTEIPTTGINVGVTTFKRIEADLGVNIGLEYIEKGYYHKVNNTLYDRLKTTHLEVPIMLDYGLPFTFRSDLKIHVKAGAYTALWLTAKYKSKGFMPSTNEFDFERNRAYRIDFGTNAGIQLEYILKQGNLGLDVKYQVGLRDMEAATTDDTRNTYRSWVIGISYVTPLIE